jgi:TonB family protein
MPHALLLSPDDQAVSAITGVLEEMSVTCERPLDGLSAAQKLSSQSFDLVLVDCENLPAAKLIFDVCRRGKDGNNPVPIAIVDGRAGLPTAFRLGAELILTKPVAKDQARTTIRTAVSRVRKDMPSNESVSTQIPAASVSPLLISYSDNASSFVSSAMPNTVPNTAPNSAATAVSPAVLSATTPAIATATAAGIATGITTGITTKMQSAVDELVVPPAISKLKSTAAATSLPSSFSESLSAKIASADQKEQKPVRPLVPSDDPVLAELEMTELEESQPPETPAALKLKLKNTGLDKSAQHQPVAESDTPVFSSYPRGRQKPRGALVALLVLALAGAGFYAAWMYQPGFRAVAQPQIDRVLALAGIAPPARSVQSTPAPRPALPAATSAYESPVATTSNPAPTTSADSVANPATASTTGSPAPPAGANATVTVQSVPATGTPVALQTTAAAINATPGAGKPEANKPTGTKVLDSKKEAAPATPSDAPLPGENTAIILSSKGAEKRLAHSVPAKYPADAASGAQGTIVLKEVVDQNGKVEGVRLVEGDASLAGAAIKAVKQWRYRPYLRDGKAQPFQTVVIIDFQRP